MRAAKACTDPHCPNLQPCPEHGRKAWEGSRRRDNLRSRSGSRGQKLRRFVLARDEYRCHVCGNTFLEAELVNDHVIPLSITGPDGDHIENMAACCIPCHDKKTKEEARRARS